MTSNRTSTVRAVMLGIMLTVAASAQTHPEPVAAKLCEVFSSPGEYNHKVVTVEGGLRRASTRCSYRVRRAMQKTAPTSRLKLFCLNPGKPYLMAKSCVSSFIGGRVPL